MKKNLKKSVSALIIALISTLTMGVYAYTGDTDDNNIQVIKQYENGKGIVQLAPSASAGYKLYYQWVSTDKDTYNQIKKINDELEIIKYYNLYTGALAAGVTDSPSGEAYENAQKKYKATYGTELTDLSDANAASLMITKKHAFPDYENSDSKWTRSTDNTLTIDLSTFSGTGYYVGWVKLVQRDGTTSYNAQVFKFEGTKVDDTKKPDDTNKPDDTKKPDDTNKPDDTKKPDDTNKPDDTKKPDDTNKPNDNKPNNTNKPDDGKNDPNDGKDDPNDGKDDTVTPSGKLPQTGVSCGTIVAMIATAGYGVVEFVKYKKIK